MSAGARRILVVDDEEGLRSTLAEILSGEGHVVATAPSGEVALDAYALERFDVVIMDNRMSGMSGLETLTRLHRHDPLSRVILMSAFAADGVKRAALEAGALAFVDKPLDLERLLALVEQAHRTAVLMVSDDPRCAELAEALQGHSYHVTLVDSVRMAAELTQQTAFRTLLLDCELGSAPGLGLFRTLAPLAPNSDVILLTGSDGADQALARERSALTCVAKGSIDPDLMLRLVARSQRASMPG